MNIDNIFQTFSLYLKECVPTQTRVGFAFEKKEKKPEPLKKAVVDLPPKQEEKKPAALQPPPKPKEKEKVAEKKEELRALIEKVHPHLRLSSGPLPEKKKVLLLCFDQGELPFYKALASAISSKLAPVSLQWGDRPFNRQDYALILAPENSPQKDVSLLSASEYEKNPALKGALWKNLCQRLK